MEGKGKRVERDGQGRERGKNGRREIEIERKRNIYVGRERREIRESVRKRDSLRERGRGI